MNKYRSLALIGVLLMLVSLAAPVYAAPPANPRPGEIYTATIEGGNPQTVDPAWSYDTASGELLMNIYESLIFFDGERLDMFVPKVATAVPDIVHVPNALVVNITGTGSGLPATSYGYTQEWYWKLIFPIRSGIKFQNTTLDTLDPQDVEYSFERAMVQNRRGGPTWMFWEMLFGPGVYGPTSIGNMTKVPEHGDVVIVGQMIDAAIGSDANNVWFNLGSGGPGGVYPPTMQIIAQTWGSILSKQWVNEVVIHAGRNDWSGNWGGYHVADWLAYRRPVKSPLDDPSPLACGTGPFEFVIWHVTNKYWEVHCFSQYWDGFPAKTPAPPYPSAGGASHIPPAGNVSTFKVSWNFPWETRRDMFLRGEVDFCAVPREFKTAVLNQPGIRCMYPIPALTVEAIFYQFDLYDPTQWTPPAEYKILPEGTFAENGFPRDFFYNATYGKTMRKAFAYALDYDTLIATAMGGEAIRPATCIIGGLTIGPGVLYKPLSPTLYAWKYNLTKANETFNSIPGLATTGFTIVIAYNQDSPTRVATADLIKTAVEGLNPRYHIIKVAITWGQYLYAALYGELPYWILGWLADFPDAHNFAMPFYHSEGDFGASQMYSNATIDAKILEGVTETDPAKRQTIYREVETLVLDDLPSVATIQGIGRHFERDWINGWYANQILPGLFAYSIWKGYYTPQKQLDTYRYPESAWLPFDITYSGLVDMTDIGLAALAFGSSYGPPQKDNWNFRADVDNNRQIDMSDIGYIALYFGK